MAAPLEVLRPLPPATVLRNDAALERRVSNRARSWSHRRSALVVVGSGPDAGLGEASPLPGYSPDRVEDCARALMAAGTALGPVRADGSAVANVAETLARIEPELVGLPAARFALECALFDHLGRRASRSVASLLREGPVHARLDRSGLLGSPLGTTAIVQEAGALVQRGIGTLKVKIGRPEMGFERELAGLLALRAALGAKVGLRLDANGAWDVQTARRCLDALAIVAPEFVEEPVGGPALLALGRCAVPWAADESLADPETALRMLDAPGCAAVVLKPAMLGGMLRAFDLGRRAQARGLGVVVTHLFDGPVALAAACELALALPERPLACGLDVHPGLAAWPSVQIAQLNAPGAIVPAEVTAHPRGGLGLDARVLEGCVPWT